jgi:hypothetical protein
VLNPVSVCLERLVGGDRSCIFFFTVFEVAGKYRIPGIGTGSCGICIVAFRIVYPETPDTEIDKIQFSKFPLFFKAEAAGYIQQLITIRTISFDVAL